MLNEKKKKTKKLVTTGIERLRLVVNAIKLFRCLPDTYAGIVLISILIPPVAGRLLIRNNNTFRAHTNRRRARGCPRAPYTAVGK